MILVTGATGQNGRLIVQRLSVGGRRVRAMVGDPEKAQALADLPGVELVAGDFEERASPDRAMPGVERAILLTPWTARAEAAMERTAHRGPHLAPVTSKRRRPA